jgi:hypothetical protein
MDQDECWFSRFAQPRMHSWAAKGEELRLIPASGICTSLMGNPIPSAPSLCWNGC